MWLKLGLTKAKAFLLSKQTQKITGLVVSGFVVLNVGIWLVFRTRTYPNTTLANRHIGSISTIQVAKKAADLQLLPSNLALTYKDKTTNMDVNKLGLSIDANDNIIQASQVRTWLPINNLFVSHHLKLLVAVDYPTYLKALGQLAQVHRQDPTNASIVITNGTFSIKPESYGYKLDEKITLNTVVQALGDGQQKITLPVEIIKPDITQLTLKDSLGVLQKQQAVSLTFRYQSKSIKLTGPDIAAWYEPTNGSYTLSDARIKAKLLAIATSFGVNLQNINEAVSATKRALTQTESLDFTFVPVPVSRAFTYCVRLKSVDSSYQTAFEAKLKAVYADGRGWSLGNQISYTQVSSDCNFTVWLASADQMPSFGTICDANWSCEVTPNVIINFDRWRYASTAWNNGGGGLDEYRSMVINHETGHWLGFGHRSCPGAGQLAPVMQQQSIDLQGCKFNAWPTPSELATLRSWLGL